MVFWGVLALNTGQECELLMLDGTLPTFYRGQQYMTPIEVCHTNAVEFKISSLFDLKLSQNLNL